MEISNRFGSNLWVAIAGTKIAVIMIPLRLNVISMCYRTISGFLCLKYSLKKFKSAGSTQWCRVDILTMQTHKYDKDHVPFWYRKLSKWTNHSSVLNNFLSSFFLLNIQASYCDLSLYHHMAIQLFWQLFQFCIINLNFKIG